MPQYLLCPSTASRATVGKPIEVRPFRDASGVDATISRARDVFWRVWAAPSASHRQAVTDATSIGDVLPLRPRAARTRPRVAYGRALELVHSDAERRFLERRLAELQEK